MGTYFGTDGIRGLANADLTPEFAVAVAGAAARVLVAHDASHRPLAVVGRDPRASGEMLEAAVVAGLLGSGADVIRLGVLPTPAVAFLTADYRADLGVMVSASHNPMPDNGIKLFSAGGHKLPDEVEDEIEAAMVAGPVRRPTGADIGRSRNASREATERYLQHLLHAEPIRLDGLRVVVDCANGAASTVAPAVYARAGAEVIAIAADPDGVNINDGVGSTHLDVVARAVREHGADLGIAHDGDADRCLAVDSAGEPVDGDQILAIAALSMRERGTLADHTVVATVMSNLGFHHAMRAAGVDVVTTAVGDRYLLEKLRERGYNLGGEQSGHVVFTDDATTGDGLLTALHLMGRMVETGRPIASLAAVVRPLPQVMINVAVHDKVAVSASPQVSAAVASAEQELGTDGRILLRPSGTENLVRVMVEAPTHDQAETVAGTIAAVVASS